MSQNCHTLLLFFDKQSLYQPCYGALKSLESGNEDDYQNFSSQLGIDFQSEWDDEWFNQSVASKGKYIRLNYETGTSYELPLEFLEQLFDAGLRAACLEVFFDQVGEMAQYYFVDGEMIGRDAAMEKFRVLAHAVEQEFECDEEELDEACSVVSSPIPIKKLRKDREKQMRDAEEAVEAMMDMFKTAREKGETKELMSAMLDLAKASEETGQDPEDILKSALVLRAAGKGLLQALAFGIVTILLFKGLWLWIALTIILAVLLPLIYVSQESAKFEDADTEDNEKEEE